MMVGIEITEVFTSREYIYGKYLSRYLGVGVLIAMTDSSHDGDDSESDHCLKEVFAVAEKMDTGDHWDLVVYGEPTTVLDGVGTSHDAKELYRMPFPSDVHVRKAMIRYVQEHSKFYEI